MGETRDRLRLPGMPEVEVRLRRSTRARRMSLRVSRLDGRVTLSLPASLRLETAEAFLARKAGWVRAHLAAAPAPVVAAPGALLPVAGEPRRIVSRRGRGARLAAGEIAVDPARPAGAQVATLLKALARDRLAAACDAHAGRLGRRYTALALRDTRSRWGSCSSAGRLMFSWRLAMAPPEVLDYVAAHEVAHLVEMNHSPAFWAHVARICPDYRTHRAWLRTHGAALHGISFAG